MRIEFSGDELILALVSLVRAIDPRMLEQGADGFHVDFEPLEAKPEPTADERLLLKFRAALERSAEASAYPIELDTAEGRRIGQALEGLERLQSWAPDVQEMSRRLRTRLAQPE